MRQLTRDDLQQAKVPVEKVEFPELDGFLYVRGLTGKERGRFESGGYAVRNNQVQVKRDELENGHARLAVLGICDEHGTRLYTDADAGEVGNMPGFILDRACDAIRRLSGMGKADLEETKKNSETAGSSGGASSSP